MEHLKKVTTNFVIQFRKVQSRAKSFVSSKTVDELHTKLKETISTSNNEKDELIKVLIYDKANKSKSKTFYINNNLPLDDLVKRALNQVEDIKDLKSKRYRLLINNTTSHSLDKKATKFYSDLSPEETFTMIKDLFKRMEEISKEKTYVFEGEVLKESHRVSLLLPNNKSKSFAVKILNYSSLEIIDLFNDLITELDISKLKVNEEEEENEEGVING